MKRVLTVLLVLAAAFAACNTNAICETGEDASCSDCSFGASVCVDDGVCTYAETKGSCRDCRTFVPSTAPQCVDDGVCSSGEDAIGSCSDCSGSNVTGLLLLGGGALFIFGFVFVGMAVLTAFGVVAYKKRRQGKDWHTSKHGRIRM
ncbi:MAG: hypothetical protein JW834_00845 [Candidatus Diapherotrites archaeon]|nr:hypothetical protein [Candidatus Diapherotrites archaeon]